MAAFITFKRVKIKFGKIYVLVSQ